MPKRMYATVPMFMDSVYVGASNEEDDGNFAVTPRTKPSTPKILSHGSVASDFHVYCCIIAGRLSSPRNLVNCRRTASMAPWTDPTTYHHHRRRYTTLEFPATMSYRPNGIRTDGARSSSWVTQTRVKDRLSWSSSRRDDLWIRLSSYWM